MHALNTFIKNYRYLALLGVIYAGGLSGIALVMLGHASAWWLLAGLVWSKIFQFLGHSIGMHRYFTHRGFETSQFWHQVMCWSSVLLGTGSPIGYSRNHRLHHRVVDTPDDLHSPANDGFVPTALGRWEFRTLRWFMSKKTVMVRDWVKDPTCRFIDKQFYRIWTVMIVLGLLINWQAAVFLLLFPAFMYHVELNLFINAIGHTWGYRNFETTDRSHNNRWINWWLLGEGLHNNHHAHPGRYDHAMKDGEFDPSGWFIKQFMILPAKA